ncbi:MAG: ferritin-like domain-containing protein, partial [Acidimicrobiales bacterium]
MAMSNEDLIGRTDINDLEAILAVTNRDVGELVHAVKDNADAIFTWDYEKGARPALNKLYEKAKHSQWNGETDLDWSIEVDPSRVIVGLQGSNSAGPFEALAQMDDSPFKNFGDK